MMMNNMTTLQKTKPHCESMRPYSYRFENIDVITPPTFREALDLYHKLKEEGYYTCDIQIGSKHPLKDQIIWSIAAHIEGNFGVPYSAIIVYSEKHQGCITIYNKWDPKTHRMMNNYLMGMRSVIRLIKQN